MAKEAKMALLSLQFMKGIPKDAHMTLLENDPTPSLNKMISFIELLGNHSRRNSVGGNRQFLANTDRTVGVNDCSAHHSAQGAQ